MSLIYNLYESVYDLYTLDANSIYSDITTIETRYSIDNYIGIRVIDDVYESSWH